MASRALALTGARGRRLACYSCRWSSSLNGPAAASISSSTEAWERYKSYFSFPAQSARDDFKQGSVVTIHGHVGRRRHLSSKLIFAQLVVPGGGRPWIQVKSSWETQDSRQHSAYTSLKSLPAHSAVSVTGTLTKVTPGGPKCGHPAFPDGTAGVEVDLLAVQTLNPFPRDIIVSEGAVYPATARHLQLRFSQLLSRRLGFRSAVVTCVRRLLARENLQEVETPLLFKSTPEGAREFLVPCRRRGLAYALPQSPQQFKQILMAGGLAGYFQFARCFRDEDLRADRQPEFTQLDLEMPFATGEDVMATVERLMRQLFEWLDDRFAYEEVEGASVPVSKAQERQQGAHSDTRSFGLLPGQPFPRLTYDQAMAWHGSDKPDLRIPGLIRRIDHIVPLDFVQKITSLDQPIVEACTFRLSGTRQAQSDFIGRFWDALPSSIAKNPDGAPAVMVFDSSKPLWGLSPLGHEAVERLVEGTDGPEGLGPFEDGDILVVQARKDEPFQGGSTALGAVRTDLYLTAVKDGLLARDSSFRFAWVTGFPMFTPDNESDPGQGGKAGFSATHHPFTAPLAPEDFDLLLTDPLRAKADHYDLVVNGVELGGGSRRIHIAKLQEFVMRDILKMSDEGVAQFSHLLDALRAGCPPHAGFALGFDRLVAVLSRTNSIRDVIAFPKTMKGEDPMVKSPGRITPEQLETYHLALRARPQKG